MTTPRDAIGLSERLRTPIWDEDTMKQWDSWRRMIDEMRGASLPRDCFESFLDGIDEERAEAATQLDALFKEREALNAAYLQSQTDFQNAQGDRDEAIKQQILAEQERDALQARVKELEGELTDTQAALTGVNSDWAKAESRATRAEQERDEAYERAAKVAEQFGEPYALNTNTGAMMFRAQTAKIAAAIRRLAAGTEKEGE